MNVLLKALQILGVCITITGVILGIAWFILFIAILVNKSI